MTDLDESAMRILCTIYEAGAENIPTLLNTIMTPNGLPQEVGSTRDGIVQLIDADLARVAIDRDANRRLLKMDSEQSRAVVNRMSSAVRFDNGRNCWTSDEPIWPEIVITSSGRAAADQIFDERGWDWWRDGAMPKV